MTRNNVIVAFPEIFTAPARPLAGAHEDGVVIAIGNAQSVVLDASVPSFGQQQPPTALSDGELWNAINEKRVRVHYQPQFDFSAGRTVAVEALARINGETGELVLPERFIEQAECNALIVPLGRAVISEVCRDLAGWRAEGTDIEHVAINLSAHQLNVDETLASFVARALAEHGLSATDLEFELTERQFLESAGTGMNTLRELTDMGASIALDDFGIGYSSVSYLAEMPVHAVKLDRSMVARIPEHRTTERVIRHLVAMALDIGVRVIGEGIETWDQHDYLASCGCHLGQGFLFAEPMAQADLADFVRCANR
jgi:EAL domain-containing protein (putative c-di-GMP-specific phosphodiesterase class I)